MAINTNFDNLTVNDAGIVLSHKKNQIREISFSDLDKIYMKVYKIKPIYELTFIMLPFLLIFFCVQYIMLEKVMFMAVFTIIPVFVKTYNYKRNGLVLCLKDGTVFRKRVSASSKSESVTMINTVKREWSNYGIKVKQLKEVAPMDFYQNKAS